MLKIPREEFWPQTQGYKRNAERSCCFGERPVCVQAANRPDLLSYSSDLCCAFQSEASVKVGQTFPEGGICAQLNLGLAGWVLQATDLQEHFTVFRPIFAAHCCPFHVDSLPGPESHIFNVKNAVRVISPDVQCETRRTRSMATESNGDISRKCPAGEEQGSHCSHAPYKVKMPFPVYNPSLLLPLTFPD